MKPETDIQYLKGVGTQRAQLLQRLGITTVGALCRFYPRDYRDWRHPLAIAAAPFGEAACIRATIASPVKVRRIRKGMTLSQTYGVDETGSRMKLTFFNNPYIADKLQAGETYLFYGKVGGSLTEREMTSPTVAATACAAIRPVYRITAGLYQKNLETLVERALREVELEDPLPAALRNRYRLLDLQTALWNIHFPRDHKALEAARRRLIFEELFLLQVGLKTIRSRDRGETACLVTVDTTEALQARLPYTLTDAQRRVICEALQDMRSGVPMNRMVQGDVGSGKTVVAAALALSAIQSGYQAALMAPTEILAEQHFQSLSKLLTPCGATVGLLTGSNTKKEKETVGAALQSGAIQLVVGTHALLQDKVVFQNLGLVITDEQHRFGVGQRAKLASKGNHPHTLVMSATPIPRTLALMIYGDLDLSIIDQLPPGRQIIKTYAVPSSYHPRIYNYIKKNLDQGRQGYIVCPLVEENPEDEESLSSNRISAESYFRQLQNGPLAGYRLGLLHGKMKPAEKETVMRAFSTGEIQLLVATTVVEVGVDVPNAVIMVIENADLFGLSQLHQLRGRVGRGSFPSSCILVSDAKGEDAKQRLKTMCQTTNGFTIADMDLKMRGPGDFFGARQHGLPDLKMANLADNMEILRIAGKEVETLLAQDPNLSDPSHRPLAAAVAALFRDCDNTLN